MSTTATTATTAKAAPEWRRLASRAALLVLLALVAGAALYTLIQHERAPITLEGVALPREGDPEPFVRALADDWYRTELTIDAGAQVVRASRRELGGVLAVEEAVQRARALRGRAPIWERVSLYVLGAPRALTFRRSVNEADVLAFVEGLRDAATVPAQPVRRDGQGGRSGTSIGMLGTSNAIRDALRADEMYVHVPVRRLEAPAAGRRDRDTARFDVVVAAHETRYESTGDLSGRAANIELATRLINNVVIPPHGELSFNEVVGERTYERGFRSATELTRGGRRTEGIGGGICQVAATLHAAAFFAGFDIVEHHPHTRNSSYIPPGLDSAVSWPNKDVRIRNAFDFHVQIRAVAYRGALRIELMGAERAPRVEWNTRVEQRIRRETEVELDPNMLMGSEEVLDEGEDGSVMERTRTVYWDDGPVTEVQRLRYPVVHRLVRRGPSSPRVLP